jgi:hypothetical protein
LQSQLIDNTAVEVATSAGDDLTARAANLSAGNDLSLDAAGQIVLYAGQNQTYAQTEQSQRKGMSYSSLDASSSETTLARTTLDAENVKLHSGGTPPWAPSRSMRARSTSRPAASSTC